MARTNQLLAIIGKVAADTKASMAQLQHVAGQQNLFRGLSRSYRKQFPEETKGIEGVQFPDEAQGVQLTADKILLAAREKLVRHWDLALTVDTANAAARADVTVGGEVLLENVPVGHLLWLAAELEGLHKLVSLLPVVDQSREWTTSGQAPGIQRTPAVETPFRQKRPGKFELSPATQYHPAQVQRLDTDDVVGFWAQVDFSGALTPERKDQLLSRLSALLEAVQMARQEANSAIVTEQAEGQAVFGYLLGP